MPLPFETKVLKQLSHSDKLQNNVHVHVNTLAKYKTFFSTLYHDNLKLANSYITAFQSLIVIAIKRNLF